MINCVLVAMKPSLLKIYKQELENRKHNRSVIFLLHSFSCPSLFSTHALSDTSGGRNYTSVKENATIQISEKGVSAPPLPTLQESKWNETSVIRYNSLLYLFI